MALSFLEASLVLSAASGTPAWKDVLMLGRQTNLLTSEDVAYLEKIYHFRLKGLDATQAAWVEPFFQRIGTSEVISLDYSDYEGAELIHDMNYPWPDGKAPRQFDLVLDGGSLEHVFNLPQALVNAMQLVKPGGLLLSVTPADGWLGHGFYQLQPEIAFRMFTLERGFSLLGCWLGEVGRRPSYTRFYRLKDPAETGVRHIIPAKRPLSLMIAARKDSEVPLMGKRWPVQSNYLAAWQQEVSSTKNSRRQSWRRFFGAFLPATLRSEIQVYLTMRRHLRESRSGWSEERKLSFD